MIVDSSFLVSLYLPGDENNSRAVNQFHGMLDDQLVIPEYVLVETLTVLNYKAGVDLAMSAYHKLMDNGRVTVYDFSASELDEIITIFSSIGGISVADASQVFLSKKLGCKVVTFDKQLSRAIAKHSRI